MAALYLHRRPRFVVLILALLATVGAAGLLSLPRLEDPTLSARFALLKTTLPGADASRMETEVTEVLEEALQDVEQIRLIRSQSRAGISVITVELEDHVTDLEAAWADIREKVDRAEAKLPPGSGKPALETVDVRAYALIAALVWTQDSEPNRAVMGRQADRLEEVLLSVPGTEKVKTFGDNPEEVSVLFDSTKLNGGELSVQALISNLERQEARVSTGEVIGEQHRHVLQTDTRFQSLADVGRTPLVPTVHGDFLPLSRFAEVRKGLQEPLLEAAFVGGKPAVVLGVYSEDRVRVDSWTRLAMAALQKEPLPPGLELRYLFEQAQTVETRFSTLVWNLFLAVVGVMAVVLAMMGWRAALVVGSAIPLTSACVLGGLVLLGIPVHQMSVTGLIVALGLLIDNAIVVADEMRVEREAGHSAAESIVLVGKRLTVPLTSSTATTVLAFLPIALLPGGIGEFVGSIAVTVIVALLSSLVLSLVLLPTVYLWLEGNLEPRLDIWNSPRLEAIYLFLFRRPYTTVVLALLLPVMGFLSVPTLKEQFFPPTDRSQIRMILELPNSRTLESTVKAAELVRESSLSFQGVKDVHWFVGRSVPKFYYNINETREREPYFAEALVELDSNLGTTELIRRMQQDLGRRFPDFRVRVIQLEQGPPFEAPVELHLYGGDLESQRQAGEALRRAMLENPDVVATKATLSENLAKLELMVDQIQVKRAGLDPESVSRYLALATRGRRVGTIFEETEAVPVVARLADRNRQSIEGLASLQIPTASGNVPLSSLLVPRMLPEQAVLAHRHQRRCNTVQAFLKAGTLPSSVLAPLLKKLESGEIKLPPGITYEVGGEAAERNRAVGNLMVYVAPLIVLMVASLVVAFSSFRLAFLVGSIGLLSAGAGFGTLAVLGIPFGFMAIIGTMGLLGVAFNDSTVVVTTLQEDVPDGELDKVARTVAGATRHVVATTFTTVAGFVPLLLGADRFWHPLAAVIAGGVVGATVLALLLCPIAYIRYARSKALGGR